MSLPGEPARSTKSAASGTHQPLRTDSAHARGKSAGTPDTAVTPSISAVSAAILTAPLIALPAHALAAQAAAVPQNAPASILDASPTPSATKPQSPANNPGIAGSNATIQPGANTAAVQVASAGNPLQSAPKTADAPAPALTIAARPHSVSTHAQSADQDEETLEATPDSDSPAQPTFSSLPAWTHLGLQAPRPDGVSFVPSLTGDVTLRHATGSTAADQLSTIAVSSSTGIATPPQQHVAAPAQRLEVAVNDPVLGRVDVRAEMRGGVLYASVAGGESSVANAMPALHQFLQEHQVAVHSLDFFGGSNSFPGNSSVSANAARTGTGDTGGGAGSGQAGGSGSQQPSQHQSQAQSQDVQTSTPRPRYGVGDYAMDAIRQAAAPVSVPANGVSSSGTVSIHI